MWIVSKYDYQKEEKTLVGAINMKSDCDGDDLYNKMEEMDWIETIDDYEVDGDDNFIAVMSFLPWLPDFDLKFIPNKRLYFSYDGIPGTIIDPGDEMAYDAKDLVDFEPLFDDPEKYDSSFPVVFGDLVLISEEAAHTVI